jgi:hypothetical protein
MTDNRPPANAFEWRRYGVEEAIRRGEYVAPVSTKPKRIYKPRASAKVLDYVRNPTQGNAVGMTKEQREAYLAPKKMHVYNAVRKNEAKAKAK